MVNRRKKKRTHVKEGSNPGLEKRPKTFVIRSGEVTRVVSQLVLDVRKVMEPDTASRLKERKRNKLKDFISMAGPLGVSHLLLFSQTETATNLRIGKFPQGPTLHFRIMSFSLMKEVMALQNRPRSPGNEYLALPLLVLNNLAVESSQGKLLCSMLQNMFPTINTSKVKLADIRRVVLFHYDREKDLLEFRHYVINVKLVGVSKSVKKIIRSEVPDLSNFADAAEYVLKAEANLSDSEMEPDSVVTLGQDYLGQGNQKNSQRSINLVECGPRMTLRLIKISEGLNTGKVFYHAPSLEDPSEKAEAPQSDSDLDAAVFKGQSSAVVPPPRQSIVARIPVLTNQRARNRNPSELIKQLSDATLRLDIPSEHKKASQECARAISNLKTFLLNGSETGEPKAEHLALLAREAYTRGLLELIFSSLAKFDFETRKEAVFIFNSLVGRQISNRTPTVEYILVHKQLIFDLIKGYERQDLALNYGIMLRECIRHEELSKLILYSSEFYMLFDYVELPTFDIASDAFATLKELISKHRMLFASFLVEKYDEFIPKFNILLQSENYVTRRQSVKLLGEILLEKCNYESMMRYISNAENLKLMMNLLRDKSKNIQYEAFHAFKIFVANPNKSKNVHDILIKNQKKLIEFLELFSPCKEDDSQFNVEKRFLIHQIHELRPQTRDREHSLEPS